MSAARTGAAWSLLLLASACSWVPRPGGPPEPRLDCVSAAVVGLEWAPVHGAAGYRILRDGVAIGRAVSGRFSDQSVAGGTDYRYLVTAVGADGDRAPSRPLVVTTPLPGANGDAPYCSSRAVLGMTWDWSQALRTAEGSDLWPSTWGQDGDVYFFFGDGGGFGGDDHRGRTSFGIARISGTPPPTPHQEVNLYGGYQSQHPAKLQGKARSLLAVGGDFFAIASVYRATDAKSRQTPPLAGSPDHLEIVYSRGDAVSWRDSGWSFCEQATQGLFCPSGFVQVGPGDRGAPDGDVYLLGNSPAADARAGGTGARTYLARVGRRRILDAGAYEYFAGLDLRARPHWTRDPAALQPIFTDRSAPLPGCGGRCVMASTLEGAFYDAGLRRYVGVAQGDYVAQTSFYEACHPWGPWRTIAYHNIEAASGAGGWGDLGSAAGGSLGVHAISAWSSADGRTLWFAYSSDGVASPAALFPPPGSTLDALQLVSVELDVAPRSTEPCDGFAAE